MPTSPNGIKVPKQWWYELSLTREDASVMKIVTIGTDLAMAVLLFTVRMNAVCGLAQTIETYKIKPLPI